MCTFNSFVMRLGSEFPRPETKDSGSHIMKCAVQIDFFFLSSCLYSCVSSTLSNLALLPIVRETQAHDTEIGSPSSVVGQDLTHYFYDSGNALMYRLIAILTTTRFDSITNLNGRQPIDVCH